MGEPVTAPTEATILRPAPAPDDPAAGARPSVPPGRRRAGSWAPLARGLTGRALPAGYRWGRRAAPVPHRPQALPYRLRALPHRLRALLRCVSGFGWLVCGGGVTFGVVAARFGWVELRAASYLLLGLFALSCLLTIGRTSLRVETRVEPPRVVAGGHAALQVSVTNLGRAMVPPMPLDVPAVGGTIRLALPALRGGRSFQDIVVLPTQARGVYPIGPTSTLRGDPFGLVRRQIRWTEPVEFVVHPRTVFLGSTGSGLLKDIEGRTTSDVSVNDLAFHALRPYVAGDDQRHIHWLSTAKRSAASGQDVFMVRQFLDTRRCHLGIVLDCHRGSWRDEAEFELAVSAGASVAVRAVRDGTELSQAIGGHLQIRARKHNALDLFARASLGAEPLGATCARLARAATGVSSVVLVTGAVPSLTELARGRMALGPEIQVVAVRVERGARMALQRGSGLLVLTIGALEELPVAFGGRMAP